MEKKQLRRRIVSALLVLMILFAAPMPGYADNGAKGRTEQQAMTLYLDYLSKHPEYKSVICLDLDRDGVDEMLVSEAERFPVQAVLCALSKDGKRLLQWNLFSRYGDYRYDPQNHCLVTDSGGTGVAEYCAMSLDGDALSVRHAGRNAAWPEREEVFYDFTETLSGNDGSWLHYSFGLIDTPEGGIKPDTEVLEKHAVREAVYQTWTRYYQACELVPLEAGRKLIHWEPAVSEKLRVIQASAGGYHTLALRNDGRVTAVGSNKDKRREINGWVNVTKIAAGIEHSVALRSDGCVYATGRNTEGQCDVGEWYDIVDVDAQHWHTIGLRADGTVVAAGTKSYGATDVSELKDIVAVSAGEYHNLCLDRYGTVHATGSDLYGEKGADGWTGIVAVDAGYNHSVGLKKDGTVVAAGRNNNGQCDVSKWRDIVAISAGGKHTVGLRSDGTVVAVGSDEFGQCRVSEWKDVVWISAGYSATIAVTAQGEVLAIGWNEYGQCNVDKLMP